MSTNDTPSLITKLGDLTKLVDCTASSHNHNRNQYLINLQMPSNILLVEDNANCSSSKTATPDNIVQIHKIDKKVELLQSMSVVQPQVDGTNIRLGRVDVALEIIDKLNVVSRETMVIGGPAYGCNERFLSSLYKRELAFAVELRPSTIVKVQSENRMTSAADISSSLKAELWHTFHITHPLTKASLPFIVTDLGDSSLKNGIRGRLIIAHIGGASNQVHRGTIFVFTNKMDISINELMRIVPWTRWIRPHARRLREKQEIISPKTPPEDQRQSDVIRDETMPRLVSRSSITAGQRRDHSVSQTRNGCVQVSRMKGELNDLQSLNTVELFAGAGGMGLGFLMAQSRSRRFRVIYSGEIEPIYAKTLQINHEFIKKLHPGQDLVPDKTEPTDLSEDLSLEKVAELATAMGGAHVVVGGPPCQGFSASNRNSGSSDNPNNRLVDVYLRYVERLQPRVFLMENVQGILWTAKSGRLACNVAHDLQHRMERAGYLVFPQLLDAIWYGVPQHRTRYFLLGIHRDLGYTRKDFDPEFGPFPQPTHGIRAQIPCVTVGQAIGDLPEIGNGHTEEMMTWHRPKGGAWSHNAFLRRMRENASPGTILDHVTSSHAPYVLERYAAIPQGGNWQSIQGMMTNYSDISRTHSNIYRRLKWDEPAVTMGHYRKSMLIHPHQHRGLSLREAMRLQTFPDWFRFAGSVRGVERGLKHKQQQLANAVCPLVLKAIAEEILRL